MPALSDIFPSCNGANISDQWKVILIFDKYHLIFDFPWANLPNLQYLGSILKMM